MLLYVVPVIGTEGTHGQAIMKEIALCPVGEGVAYGYGAAHLSALHINSIARHPGLCWMEYAVGSGHLKEVAGCSVVKAVSYTHLTLPTILLV